MVLRRLVDRHFQRRKHVSECDFGTVQTLCAFFEMIIALGKKQYKEYTHANLRKISLNIETFVIVLH